MRIAFICPTYQAQELHAYTSRALTSFFETTPNGVAIVVDDGSASWSCSYEDSLQELASRFPGRKLYAIHFKTNGGLTRSWNVGLARADELKCDYAIAGNNDVIFTKRWHTGLLHALEYYAMVGPLSNAPGITAKGAQEIQHYLADYRLTDDQEYLDRLADTLLYSRLGEVIESPVNGFFQMAKMSSWLAGKYDETAFYRPVNMYTSKGKNPTPLMTMNEDEIQARWRKQSMPSAVVLSSFIFHYRAVSRGDKYKRGLWYRLSNATNPSL